MGYRLEGHSAGPTIVVAGSSPDAEKVFDRLISIPTLRWMRGTLILVRLDLMGEGSADVLSGLSHDRTVVLPFTPTQDPDQQIRNDYFTVLRVCADMGMISGRGVAREESFTA